MNVELRNSYNLCTAYGVCMNLCYSCVLCAIAIALIALRKPQCPQISVLYVYGTGSHTLATATKYDDDDDAGNGDDNMLCAFLRSANIRRNGMHAILYMLNIS